MAQKGRDVAIRESGVGQSGLFDFFNHYLTRKTPLRLKFSFARGT
uniref:Uncharacterized protein n=1 Tax=Anguilla anguilla TaxID=7936 RepID=A0A0E9PC93_ANGAN